MKYVFLLGFFTIICVHTAYAQQLQEIRDGITYIRSDRESDIYNYELIDGTPYTNDEFRKARLSGTNGDTYLIRYDAYRDVLQFKDNNETLKSLSPEQFYRFDFTEQKGAIIVVIYPNQMSGFGFLVWENDNGYQLIRKEVIRFNYARKAKDSYSKDKPPSFSKVQCSYYLRKEKNGKLIKIPYKRASALQLLGKKATKLARQNNLDIRKEEDLAALLKLVYGE